MDAVRRFGERRVGESPPHRFVERMSTNRWSGQSAGAQPAGARMVAIMLAGPRPGPAERIPYVRGAVVGRLRVPPVGRGFDQAA